MRKLEISEQELDMVDSRDPYWVDISRNYILTEDLIRKYQDKVYWQAISMYQKLSEEFLKEFEDKINFSSLLSNANINYYSEETQRFILEKTISIRTDNYYLYLTPYMRQQYNKLSIML